jgi:very-short-patch-repair endonuclease
MRGPRQTKTRLSRRLRGAQTDTEGVLWRHLRNRQLAGYKFVRQEPVGPFICDFVCRDRRLIIEADGGQHADSPTDAQRDQWFFAHGYRVLRFWNNDILTNLDGVLTTIAAALGDKQPHC